MATVDHRARQEADRAPATRVGSLCVDPSGSQSPGGDVTLVGGDPYADYREQLLPCSECQQRLPAYCAKVALPETATRLVQAVKDELTRVAAEVDAALPTLKDDVTISAEGQPVLKRVVAKEIPASAVALERWLDRRLPYRKLLDVLTNLEQWTHFTRHF